MKSSHFSFVSQIMAISAIVSLALPLSLNAQATEADETRNLNEHLMAFAPYEGTWICESEWTAGGAFWAKNEYAVGMNGNFLEAATFARNSSGGIYQRYKTTWLYNMSENRMEAYGFTYDGTVIVTYPEIDSSGEGQPVIRSQWKQPGGTFVKQEVQMNADLATYHWRVWSSKDEKNWNQIMDGTWKKQSD